MVSAISNVQGGETENCSRREPRAWAVTRPWGPKRGAGGLPHLVPCTTTFHLLSYTSQHIPYLCRPVNSAHWEHAWTALETRGRWDLRNNMELELLLASCAALRCWATIMTPPAARLISCIRFSGHGAVKLGPAVAYSYTARRSPLGPGYGRLFVSRKRRNSVISLARMVFLKADPGYDTNLPSCQLRVAVAQVACLAVASAGKTLKLAL
jgi:hypothetical protein